MPLTENDIILHNYPQSPVAEKVRVVLGIKTLAWHNVEIPRLPPKPMLTALTGGYRRTPVMQIGADIFCDSQCIIRELENRFPSPSLTPGDQKGLLWCLSRWTDGNWFDIAVKVVLGSAGDALPEDFARDRGRLYFGPDWAEGIRQANSQLAHWVSQLATPLAWLNEQLSDGRDYLLGSEPAAVDAQIYYVVWFIRGRWDQGPGFLARFPFIEKWESRVAAIGHGQATDASPEDAISCAKAATISTPKQIADDDPLGLRPGDTVTIQPDVDGGEQPVTGNVRFLSTETIAIERQSDDAGLVCVNFPRAGYRIS